MPKLPRVSGSQLVRLLQSLGYEVIRQRGSHVRLKKVTTLGEHAITIPVHKVIAKGTLSDIIGKVSLWNNISREELSRRLRQSYIRLVLITNLGHSKRIITTSFFFLIFSHPSPPSIIFCLARSFSPAAPTNS